MTGVCPCDQSDHKEITYSPEQCKPMCLRRWPNIKAAHVWSVCFALLRYVYVYGIGIDKTDTHKTGFS